MLTSDLPSPPVPAPDDSLFLDFDGTLVAIAVTPDAIRVEPGLPELLDRLAAAMPGRVALVSGRSIAQLDGFLATPHLAVAGSHGAEHRTPGAGHVVPPRSPALTAAAAELARFAEQHDLVFENKSFGAALHYRERPVHEAAAKSLAARIAATHGLTLQHGKMMVEVRLPGDKGSAIRTLAADGAMAGTTPWFLGDDVTDEDGFVAAAELGGAGILVGPARPTAARYRLDDVSAVHRWLTTLLERLA